MMLGLLPYLLAGALVVGIWAWDRVTISSLRGQVSTLQTEIDDPMTGWRRNLAVCIQNADMFSMELTLVGSKIDDLGKKADAIVADQKQLGIRTQRDGQMTRNVVLDILKQPVEGDTSCERSLNVLRAPLPRF